MADDLYDDLYEFLRTEELRGSYKRAQMEYTNQLARIRAPGFQRAKRPEDRNLPPEAERLWGPDKSKWRIGTLALQRAIDKERERGVAEDVLAEVEQALQLMCERMAAEIKEKRRQKKLAKGFRPRP